MVITSYDIAARYLFGSSENDTTVSVTRLHLLWRGSECFFFRFCCATILRHTPPELGLVPRTGMSFSLPKSTRPHTWAMQRHPLLRALFSLEINCVSILFFRKKRVRNAKPQSCLLLLYIILDGEGTDAFARFVRPRATSSKARGASVIWQLGVTGE